MAACQVLPHEIYLVDTGYLRDRMDAIHIVVSGGRAAIVESGTSRSVPRVLAALDSLNLPPAAVDWVMLTHVHLDHAGGAGALLQQLPEARLLVHPRGARHMIDPSKLWAGTVAVYGEAFALNEYGELIPVAASRVVEAHDGLIVEFGGRSIEVADTPGHARHHVCYWDETSRGWFTGDTFGLSYRETHVGERAFILPTSTPTQFEPEALHRSIERLLRKEPECMHLTHYSTVTDVPRLASDMHRLIDRYVALARAVDAQDSVSQYSAIFAGLESLVREEAASQGWAVQGEAALALYAGDLALNAQGLQGWVNQA